MDSTFLSPALSMAPTGVTALQTKQLMVMGAWTVRCFLARQIRVLCHGWFSQNALKFRAIHSNLPTSWETQETELELFQHRLLARHFSQTTSWLRAVAAQWFASICVFGSSDGAMSRTRHLGNGMCKGCHGSIVVKSGWPDGQVNKTISYYFQSIEYLTYSKYFKVAFNHLKELGSTLDIDKGSWSLRGVTFAGM